MQTKRQTRNQVFNGAFGQQLKWIIRILLLVVAFVVIKATISDTASMLEEMNDGQPVTAGMVVDIFSHTDSIKVEYPHGIIANVLYDKYQGYPIVDSTMSHDELLLSSGVIEIRWTVPKEGAALSYYNGVILGLTGQALEREIAQYDSL